MGHHHGHVYPNGLLACEAGGLTKRQLMSVLRSFSISWDGVHQPSPFPRYFCNACGKNALVGMRWFPQRVVRFGKDGPKKSELHSKGVAHVCLVIAKTKVAPVTRMTVPRLELFGALIVARLLKHASNLISIPSEAIFAWTDSRVVLWWLRGDPRIFKAFVGNRVSEVLELTPPNAWRLVLGKDNPADCSSRVSRPSSMVARARMVEAYGDPVASNDEHSLVYDSSEERNTSPSLVVHVLHTSVQTHALPLLTRISSYSRLIRVTARILRFIYNLRHPQQEQGALSTKYITK